MGTMYLASAGGHLAAAAKSTGNSTFTFLFIGVIVVVFYLLIMRPQRNRQRNVQRAQTQAEPGARIRTTAGMYGTIISGDDRDIVVEIAPGVQITMLRRAVMEVLPEDEPEMEPEPETEQASDDAAVEDDDLAAEDLDVKDSL